jgi:transcriptional regulator with XRE-family HTH domain
MASLDIAACGAAGLGRSLKTWRALRRIKQSHAARLLGVSQATVSRWESGALAPTLDEQRDLRTLMSARLDSAAEHALARLVRQSPRRVHLVCDLTHRLLAASRPRARAWRVPLPQLMGVSLWPYASAEIAAAEARLSDLGWFEAAAPMVEIVTGPNHRGDIPIRQGKRRWTRFQLSDGSYARLVEAAGPA